MPHQEHQDTQPKISEMMIKLYGADEAQKVYARCQEVDPWFNDYVQRIIYDVIWSLPPLDLLQKSLATMVTLATLKKDEQLQIHIKGFYNLGGTSQDITSIFNYMADKRYIASSASLLELVENLQNKSTANQLNMLDAKNKAIIDLSATAALGDNASTKELIIRLLEATTLTSEEVKGVFRHIMTYAGCPCTMNGFAVLKEIEGQQDQTDIAI